MRKIEKNEIAKAARAFAEMFSDYELYKLFYADKERRIKGARELFGFEVYASANYTYVDDDFLTVACVKRPGDRARCAELRFLNPFFALKFVISTGIRAMKLSAEYMKFTQKIASEYYNSETDCYLKNIGVAAAARGQGRLRRAIDELCGNRAVFLETHSAVNVEIYRKLGFEVCKTADFHGVTHYAMRREARCESAS